MKLNPFRIVLIKTRLLTGLLIGAIICFLFIGASYYMVTYTSTNEYCDTCHVHPHVTESWKAGLHYETASGMQTKCVECHLPPPSNGLVNYLYAKGKAGVVDIYGFYFKDHDSFNWEQKSTLEYAPRHVYNESCEYCHVELYPKTINSEGLDAHIYYEKNRDTLECINCHLKVGHYHETPDEQILAEDLEVEEPVDMAPLITEIGEDKFADYTEIIPTSGVKFEMVAIDGGTFNMGASPSDPNAEEDEIPSRQVEVDPFWMGKFEVSWQEFDSYYTETVTREKNEAGLRLEDAVTGPTPPYGSPDQGWGKGLQPAITMRHYTAEKYCEWLSQITGRKYRLPTEAEWEYAARAGTEGPYFFAEEDEVSWLSKIFGGGDVDPEVAGQYAVFQDNSKYRTQPPRSKEPNPWGLYNMLGNVKEFCSDWYSPDILSQYPEGQITKNPTGPETGTEYVIRGGSFRSPLEELRSSARDFTRTEQWMRTDPQTPKSVWWYSDVTDVGFRIVRELDEDEIQGSN